MQRISTLSKALNLFGIGKHGFRNGDMATSTPATAFDADWCNGVQEELLNVIEAAGLTPSAANFTQLLESIQRMIDIQSGNYLLDTGAANAYVVALSPAIEAYTNGMTVRVRITHTNTGASTLNAGGGVVPLLNDVGDALLAGDAPVGGVVTATFDAVENAFLITSLVQSQAMSQAAADLRYAAISVAAVPAGTLIDFAGTAAPAGYLACPLAAGGAQLVSRVTYAALFAAIGTTWGVGDGVTTFGIPYFPANYAAVQANANEGTETVGEVIGHDHPFTADIGDTVMNNYGYIGAGGASQETPTLSATGNTGGTANLAAGMRVMKCVKI